LGASLPGPPGDTEGQAGFPAFKVILHLCDAPGTFRDSPSISGAPRLGFREEAIIFPPTAFYITWYCAPIVACSRRGHSGRMLRLRSGARSARVARRRQVPPMPTIDRQELDRLERRNLQLTILSAVFVLVLAGGLASFMYPLVFVHPEGNKWTMRVTFFGFCALTLLFVGYLFDRQRTFTKLKHSLLAELERNITLQIQASTDLLRTMPDQNHFWDRLSMEFRRAHSMEKTMSLVLAKASANSQVAGKDQQAAYSDAAKAMARRLRPTDSIYRLADGLFGIVLPGTDTLNAKRIAVRLQEGLQDVRAKYGLTFDLSAYNYPDHVKSSHELEDIVKSLLPEEKEWEAPVEVPVAG
jgi:GGDEF domain-containing protein